MKAKVKVKVSAHLPHELTTHLLPVTAHLLRTTDGLLTNLPHELALLAPRGARPHAPLAEGRGREVGAPREDLGEWLAGGMTW